MTRGLGRVFSGFKRLVTLSVMWSMKHPMYSVPLRSPSVRSMAVLPLPFGKPKDLSLPNATWGPEMMQLYEHYNSLCKVEVEAEGGQKKVPWKRIPGYNRLLKYATGGVYLSKMIQSKARLFTRNIREPGAAFEYALFINSEEEKCVGIWQVGHLLEGPPGHVHGGAIATIIDTVTGCLASLSGAVMTANLNINYRSPIQLGNTVVVESIVDKREGRKKFISCKVTSPDGTKLHTEATALFLSIDINQLLLGR
ncbi:acyl-coenzyme A thioesterase THEM4 isoform X2 [Xyrichtys novacula]|uniref:Acyl-coenzyme A thioesterase THEM4 n=1 Tax=Xyrichtys novacula TaxID=13765 RepID=A0AAV1FMI2_XYRNO|nr:acyl-coenzyme A thioesterase THEM4 isoform X2 [Xyrichtys novacula]